MSADAVSAAAPPDRHGRPLHDLRVSVTDRCNFRCAYCMPKEVFNSRYRFLQRERLLRFEELERLARLFAELGVRKLRLTGGEPLLRRGLEGLVERLAGVPGIRDLCLTTNGSLLTRDRARALAAAGLNRVTVSLDGLDDAAFRRLNGVDAPVAAVLEAIERAHEAGLGPVKVNMVVQRGVNEDQILPMAEHFRGMPHILRYIEYMDVGSTNDWRREAVVPAAEVRRRLEARWPLEAMDAHYPGEVARRWRWRDGRGEIGLIASVTQPFCGGCGRARLSADGKLYTCLFAARGHDLRAPLRAGDGDGELRERLRRLWAAREDRYSELRGSPAAAGEARVEMSYIGG